MKILLLNSPPRSGKDTLAQYIVEHPNLFPDWNIGFDKFSMPMKAAFAGMTQSRIDVYGNVDFYEQTKEKEILWLGVSFHQFQIDMSEKFMKPLYGDDIFTRMFYARVLGREQEQDNKNRKDAKKSIFVVADCGFNVELQALLDYGVRAEDILLMRVHRPGCTYKGDSRSYIYNKAVLACDIQNDGTKEQYYNRAVGAMKIWLAGGAGDNSIFDYKDGDRR